MCVCGFSLNMWFTLWIWCIDLLWKWFLVQAVICMQVVLHVLHHWVSLCPHIFSVLVPSGWSEDIWSTSSLMSKLPPGHDGWLSSSSQPRACSLVFCVYWSRMTTVGKRWGMPEMGFTEILLIFRCCVRRAKALCNPNTELYKLW